ncbi:DUF362 domain-containing protein [Myxococcota bacterium]|nr:DUF362 domain-containing protein [Myxococcota bacterium]
MRRLGLIDRRLLRRERERWIDARPPGPLDGRDPQSIPGGPSRLVVARNESALHGSAAQRGDILRTMLARGLRTLTGEPDERSAWASLLSEFRPGHVVGIKLNTVAVHLAPHQEVVDALVASLAEGRVERQNIVLWDNLGRLGPIRMRFYGDLERPEGAYYQGMERAGFAPDSRGAPRILCTVPRPPGLGYDRKVRAEIPSRGLRLPVSRILTRVCDHIINLPVPKDHRVTGITCALKNFYGCVPLWDSFRPTHADGMHANRGDPQIAELYANPCISGKVRLHVCDALRAICDGGPWGEPQLEPHSLLLATDPVALDAYVLALLDGARRKLGMERVSRRAGYLESSARRGLGTNDPNSITVVDALGRLQAWPS